MRIENLNFAYGDKKIFQDLNMDMPKGVTCIMGGSGAGKTTLHNCISRQLDFDGNIAYDAIGDDCNNCINFAYVFQQPRLIPSMSVEDNIKFVLPRSLTKEQVKQKVDVVIAKLQLEDCRKSYPSKISGGQASRVSLARALVTDSNILLLDEPFKGLDVKLKKDILNLLIPLIENKSVVFVTHDVEEALAIADKVFVFERKDGEAVMIKGCLDIEQKQAGRDIYGEQLNRARKQIYELLS
ncbi:MAG: ABC transporter ATP-binding protein [Clostridia bacterium]|nr:ABC transporter ATP-binding protein [Clostridia bacterium]